MHHHSTNPVSNVRVLTCRRPGLEMLLTLWSSTASELKKMSTFIRSGSLYDLSVAIRPSMEILRDSLFTKCSIYTPYIRIIIV